MSATVPIPANLWRKMLGFLEAGTTGQVILDVKSGQVEGVRLTEFVRADHHATATPLDERCDHT